MTRHACEPHQTPPPHAASPVKPPEGSAAFHAGQLVVHPTHGFCRIAAIERARVRDGVEECYVFRMGSASNPIKVLMPVAQAATEGLRRPITSPEAEEVLQVFHRPATPLEAHSKEEMDAVAARLKSRDLRLVASTIRDLVAAGVKGWLGQPDGALCMNHRRSEEAMLTQALGHVTEEVSYVRRTSRQSVEDHIRKCLGRTRRRRAPQALRN